MKKQEMAFVTYQYVLLAAMISFLAWNFYVNKEFHEMILGVLTGLMVGITFPKQEDDY